MHWGVGGTAAPVLLATCLVVAGACSPGSRRGAPRREEPSHLDLVHAGRTFGVGRTDLTYVDSSRGTPADPTNHRPARPDRTLPTVILYPTDEPSDDARSDDHPMSTGRFPLLVFVHGRTGTGPSYSNYLEAVAAKGYVVALPTMPLTSGAHAQASFAPVVSQPADVRFLIERLLAEASVAGNLLHSHLAPGAVAVGGHSLGALTTLLFTNSCCHDPQVKAIVAASGELYPGPEPTDSYDDPPPDLPMLLLHGAEDPVIPYRSGSKRIFDRDIDVPRALVTFPTAGHVDLLGRAAFADSIVAFLDLVLRNDAKRWHELSGTLARDGAAHIVVAGSLPTPS